MCVEMAVDCQLCLHSAFGVGACSNPVEHKGSSALGKYFWAKVDWRQQMISGMKVAGPSQIPTFNYHLEYRSGARNLEPRYEACSRCQDLRQCGLCSGGKIQLSSGRTKRSDRLSSGFPKVWDGLEYRKPRGNSVWRAAVAGDDSTTKLSVHFIGIGGSGLSALAMLALQQGWQVSGSDITFSERLQLLREAGARVYVGHAAEHIVGTDSNSPLDAVVVSSAVPSSNEEIQAAKALGVPIYNRGEWLGRITDGYELLAVAGSHGKSTTTAMLATVLRELKNDITAIVGAEVPQFPGGGNAICGRGQRFVLEADEYDGCFLGVAPSLAVVTSVDWEHVDIFPDEASVRKVFRQFVQRIKPGGTLVVCGDSAGSKILSTAFQGSQGGNGDENTKSQYYRDSRQVVTYGIGDGNDWQAILLAPNVQGGTDYIVVYSGRPMARMTLQLPGTHNVLNSLAVVVVASLLASQDSKSSSGEESIAVMKRAAEAASGVLAQFVGIKRRFEFVGRAKGCVIYDDYAHHPTEVRAVLQATRQRFDQQPIWVVFQPHTYSRLAKLLHDFAPAFSAADRVIVTEVYSAREDNAWNISGADLARIITGPPAIFVPTLDKVVERLEWELTLTESMSSQGVILLTLGADCSARSPKAQIDEILTWRQTQSIFPGDITEVGYALRKTVSDREKCGGPKHHA